MRTVTFRFVHAADLHLGFPFSGLTDASAGSPRLAELLARAPFDAFERVVDLALERKADALFVAGDVYHAADRTLAAQLAFRDGCARAAAGGVRVYVAHGNHDPLSGWQAGLEMPDRVHVFGPHPEAVPLTSRNGTDVGVVVGWSFPAAAVPESPVAAYAEVAADAVEAGARFVVGVLHTEIGGDPDTCPYAPTTPAELAAAPVDLWALGHVHGFRKVLDHPGGPVAVYPGTPQGRHPGETGPRGCCLVTVHDFDSPGRRIEVEPVATDAVRWQRSEVDLTDVTTVDALLERLVTERDTVRAAADGRPVLWCVELTGRTPLHDTLARLDLVRDLAQPLADETTGVWIARLALRTARPLDLATLERRRDLVGDLAREAALWAEAPDGDLASTLRQVLDARPEAVKIAPDLDRLLAGDDAPRRLLAAARELAFDLLLVEDAP